MKKSERGKGSQKRKQKPPPPTPENTEESDSEEEYDFQRKCSQRNEKSILPRPNASPGYWLCCLVPLAFGVRYLPSLSSSTAPLWSPHQQQQQQHQPAAGESTDWKTSTAPTLHHMLTVAAIGMCIESFCFFMYFFLKTGILVKLIISFVPGLITTTLYAVLFQQSWRFGFFWGFAVTFCYQNVYIRILSGFKYCFSYGEATIVVQGLMLFVMGALLQLGSIVGGAGVRLPMFGSLSILPNVVMTAAKGASDFEMLSTIMTNALFCLVLAVWLLSRHPPLRTVLGFYGLMAGLLFGVTCLPVTRPVPVVTLFRFMLADERRLSIIALYFALVGLTVLTIWWQMRKGSTKASTRMRKIFHLLIVLVYIPGLRYQYDLLYIATGIALAIFSVLELFRILQIPPLADTLTNAFSSFCDEKDAGILATTPFSLLIGCSLPIWLSKPPMAMPAQGGYLDMSLLPLLAGILAVGCGDTAASVVGSKIGRFKWRSSSRTIEGTAAFIVAILGTVWYLHWSRLLAVSVTQCAGTAVAAIVCALVEAHTDQIDNLVLPLIFYIIVSLAA